MEERRTETGGPSPIQAAAAALARGDAAYLAPDGRRALIVEAHLDDAEREARSARAKAEGLRRVPRLDGLAAWRIRADFVAERVANPTVKRRLGKTLRPPRGRQRFSRALACHPGVKRAFGAFARDALEAHVRAWLASAP